VNFYKLDPFPVNLGSFCPACMLNGMGSLGAEDCQGYLTNVDIYTRLSKKTDKTKETRARAAQMAADNQAAYNACVDRNATAAVQSAISPTASAPAVTPAATTVSTVANSLLQAATQALVPSQAVAPGQTVVPVAQPVALPAATGSTGLLTPKNLMIAGGVLAVGALIYFMMRKRS
jgi:hypothetical protein